MKKFTKILAVLMMAVATFAGCSDYDDSGIRKELTDLEERVGSLESLTAALNAAQADGLTISSYTALPGGAGWKITFSNGFTLDVVNGADGTNGVDGTNGADGNSPYVGTNGNWYIAGTDTGVKAAGTDGQDGNSPYVGTNGNWYIAGTDTGVKAAGTDGQDGNSPYIGTNGNWYIGGTDTGVKAAGTDGKDGNSPHIGPNGNWFVGNTDTGVKAAGKNGDSFIESIAESTDGKNIVIKLTNGDEYSFFKGDPAVHMELIGFGDPLEIPEGTTAEVRFRINPSDAFVATGSGSELDGIWMLDQSGTRTRADINYVTPPANFELVSLQADMAGSNVKRGQYVATIRCTERDPAVSQYAVSLVLNTGTALVSSPVFVLGVPAPAAIVNARYTTVAYEDPSEPAAEPYKIVYAKRTREYNYYVYYAGYVDMVPLLYQQAVYYNGQTPITVGYSKDTSIETAVTQGIQKAVETSFEATVSLEVSVGTSTSVGFLGTGAEISTEIKTGVSASLGGSVSTTNTLETTESKVQGESFSTEATIGTMGEPAGMYRYALFATTDVFYNVKVDRATGKVVEATRSLCARPTTYWGIDYDPQLGGESTFGKTGDGDKLGFPEFDPTNLPPITLQAPVVRSRVYSETDSPIYSEHTYMTYDFEAPGSYPLKGERVTFYFTLDGTEPTKEGHYARSATGNYTAGISIDGGVMALNYNVPGNYGFGLPSYEGKATLKIFCSMPGALDSPVTEQEVRIYWHYVQKD